MRSRAGSARCYAKVTDFWPHGVAKELTLGNGLVESTTFNNRLQPVQISAGLLMSLSYGYTSTQQTVNDGNIV
jgi:hypothetical protein